MKKIVFTFNIIVSIIILTQCQQKQNVPVTQEDEGKKLFEQYCVRCHLEAGNGGPTPTMGVDAPDIRQSIKSQPELVAFISNGWGKMPSFKDSTSDENISMIATYVATQVEKHSSNKSTSTSRTLINQ
jgi:mono/diheme cytochrome c family protein